jgi:hypothetical protein
MIRLPEVYARRADADLFGNFSHRQPTFDAGVPKVSGEIRLARQSELPKQLGYRPAKLNRALDGEQGHAMKSVG